jgi:uncharacterized protein YbjT (DUF2867 family)
VYVLVTGARGFVGSALMPALLARGHNVRAGVRDTRGSGTASLRTIRCDLDDDSSVRAALHGQDAAYYLVHGLKRSGRYGAWEEAAAQRFVSACADAGVQRIVYLGGPDPGPKASAHLQARLCTGAALRAGAARAGIAVVELRAAMILGRSDSFRLARDLAMRLPAIVSSPWMETRQQPVAIDDMVVALAAALTVPAGIYAVPGPEIVSGRELMVRMKRACGMPVVVFGVGRGSRRIAGRVAGWLTRVDAHVAQELVQGMGRGDLTSHDDGIWSVLPQHTRIGVDEAIRRALAADDPGWRATVLEGALRAAARFVAGERGRA